MHDDKIVERLRELSDSEYREFQAKLIPNLPPEKMIGVRTPDLRKFAKEFSKSPDADVFLRNLPHEYFDENQLHGFIISEQKDFEKCISLLEDFLPHIDNWATCDQLSPKVFKKHHDQLLPRVKKWIESPHCFTVRFGIGMLMQHFLDEDFNPDFLKTVASIKSDEYYVKMMIAWYFATALTKRYDETLPFIEQKKLDKWTHNKTIQKSIESYRISDEKKAHLKSMKLTLLPDERTPKP
ncbi:MAG: DNA alkylation repair protein [Treponema sp.]|nr:DNA alkylation repair protein [Treponema sp.]